MAKNGKLLYHLTALENLESILQNGLQPRTALVANGFTDVADSQIISSRELHGLEHFVPFHFFAKSPFDYGVQRSRRDEHFVLITVRRAVAAANNWKIVPRHPLAEEGYAIIDYVEGIEAIDWSLIAKRNYDDRACKVACMAECLSPNVVLADKIFGIYVKTEVDQKIVLELAKKHSVSCYINLAAYMFAGAQHV
ncbi:DarT ssDNA thymidine ADP-ribosyltransferase family protein [Shewanella oncorhynchi]|uniref:DarT ssDNA thymidine ADP-ribosyltransferase family protein n=1 Tax=Shewanella oncorhynchi TaxID=2726434 RepID=UPI003D79DD3C